MLRIYASCLLFFLLSGIAFAQTPELVADVNATGDGFDEFKTTFLTVGNKTVLVADNGSTGFELYVLENNGLSLLKDIFPNATSSQPASFAVVNDKIYFAATDSLHGRELWVTDGTPAGTTLAYDLEPGTGSSNPINLTASASGRLFFEKGNRLYVLTPGSAPVLLSAPPYVKLTPDFNTVGAKVVPFKNGIAFVVQDAANANFNQIWTSDGTPGGTVKVKSYPATFFDGMRGLMALADKVLFTIDNAYAPADSINGLYVTDGLPSGTVKLVAAPGQSNPALPQRFMPADQHKAYYYTQEGVYTTDGTLAGTIKILANPHPSIVSGQAYPFVSLSDKALFVDEPGFLSPVNLHQSDGTVAGTTIMKALNESFVLQLTHYRNKIFFVSGIWNGFTPKIWESDLTEAGTKSIYDYTSTSTEGPSLVILGFVDNYLYYQSNLGGVGRELYRIKIDVAASTDTPGALTSAYSLQYGTPNHLGRILSDQENEPLTLHLFDLQGRELQRLEVISGEQFQTTSFTGLGVLTVHGKRGTQSFKIVSF